MSMHAIKPLDRNGLRGFGFLMGGVVAALFGMLLPWAFEGSFVLWPWLVAAAFVSLALLAPKALHPVYIVWMRFGLLASKITTPILLGIVFYLIVTPTGLVRRFINRDPIPRRGDPARSTYRVPSKSSDPKKLERPF